MTKKSSARAVEPDVEFPQDRPEQASAIAVMQAGAALVKAENDSLIEYAIRYPRNPVAAIKQAMDELEIDPEFASKQWYSIPYRNPGPGQPVCPCQGGKVGHPKDPHTLVEGVSIKGALSCARAWGNCGGKARTIERDDDHATVEGLAIDRQTGFTFSREVQVSRIQHRRSGGNVKLSDGDFDKQIVIAGSKAARNALLAIMPEALIRRYWARAREIAAALEAKPAGAAKKVGVIEAFAPYLDPKPKDAPDGWRFDRAKVKAQIELILKCPLAEASKEELADLRGILNALESGEAAVRDYFPGTPVAQEGDEGGDAPAPDEGSPLRKGTK